MRTFQLGRACKEFDTRSTDGTSCVMTALNPSLQPHREVSLFLKGFVFTLLLVLGGCDSLCHDTVVSKRPGPDGHYLAVVFYRDCGATTPFTTEISIVRSDGNAVSGSHAGNIFSMTDPPDRQETLSRNGVIEVRLKWISPRRLAIATPRRAVVGKRLNRFGDIKIDYSTFD